MMTSIIRKHWVNHFLNDLLKSTFPMVLLVAIGIMIGNEVHAAKKPVVQVNFKYVVGKMLEGDLKDDADEFCPEPEDREKFEKSFIDEGNEYLGYLNWSTSSYSGDQVAAAEWNIIFKADYLLKDGSTEKGVKGTLAFSARYLSQAASKPSGETHYHCLMEDQMTPDPSQISFIQETVYATGTGLPYGRPVEFATDIDKKIKAQFKALRDDEHVDAFLKKIPIATMIIADQEGKKIIIPLKKSNLRTTRDTELRVTLNHKDNKNRTIDMKADNERSTDGFVEGWLTANTIGGGVDLKSETDWDPKIIGVIENSTEIKVRVHVFHPLLCRGACPDGVAEEDQH